MWYSHLDTLRSLIIMTAPTIPLAAVFGVPVGWLLGNIGPVIGVSWLVLLLLSAVLWWKAPRGSSTVDDGPDARAGDGSQDIDIRDRTGIVLEPEVVPDEQYGPKKDEKAFTVCLHVRSVDGAPHAGAEGRLVSLTPITNEQKILKLPDITPGLLQWVAFGSGNDRSTITRGGVSLDVIVLENSDRFRKVVYFNDNLRDRSRIYLDVAPWRAVVEVTSDDGTSAEVTFNIFQGEDRELLTHHLVLTGGHTLRAKSRDCP